MSNNILRLSKQHSQPNNSTPANLVSSSHSLLHPQHIPQDNSKERESVLLLKDTHPNTTTAQSGIKKLAFFLDPRKDLQNSLSPNHTSPKSFLGGSSNKSSKLKISASSLENSNLNLISPKDLVRLAMSRHKPKAAVKKVAVESTSSLPRNVRKSLSLRFGPGANRLDKHEGSTSKLGYNSIVEENSILSKTALPLNQEKNAKLKRMKLIYNDMNQPDLARLTKSTAYTPQEASGRMWQGTISPNRSNSGLLWLGSPNGPVNATSVGNSKSKLHLNQIGVGGSEKMFSGKEFDDEKGEQSYRKRASIEQMGSLKDLKPMGKQSKRKEKNKLQPRKMTSMDAPKATSVSFSRLMSHNTLNQDAIDRAKSPSELKVDEDQDEETIEIFEETENVKNKPREGFIADLKSWVNDIVKPQDDMSVLATSKKDLKSEKVKEAQEGLLEKLREALDNDEFVRREDYERLYREKDSIEEELDAVKEENAQLRAMLWKIQEENEEREQRQIEERKALKSLASGNGFYEQGMSEESVSQNKEYCALKKRENVVKDILKMIWKAGIEIGDLHMEDLMKNEQEIEEQEAYEQKEYYGSHVVNQKSAYMPHTKYTNNLQPIGEHVYKEGDAEDESYTGHIPEQGEEGSDATSSKLIALSEMGDSEPALSVRQPLEIVTNTHLMNAANKVSLSINNLKSTADNSLIFSAKAISPQSCFGRGQGKLKLDLTGLGGNLTAPKPHMLLGHSSAEPIPNYIVAEGGQSLGFHEEFMSKLEEFSLSWRQDALNYQKF